jgi:hypothetical protein
VQSSGYMTQAIQPAPALSKPHSHPKKPAPLTVRAGDFMQLADALRAALLLLGTATDALEQDLGDIERFKIVCGLRRSLATLRVTK